LATLTCQVRDAQVNTLGRYEILGELGRGVISVVYDARDLLTGASVALKLIEPSLWAPPTSAAERLRFLTEAMPEWRLRHPNIVTVHDAGDGDGRLYIAMERLDGRTLRRMLDRESPLPGVGRSLRMAAEFASALAWAHQHGVVHRYLNPSNLFILADGRPMITDFGMAPLRDAALASRNHTACLRYMSPEEMRCEASIDGRSDIFCLGVVLYEMLTGKLPFGGESPAEIMRNVLDAEPLLPSEINPAIPPEVDSLVWSMLTKNADDRVTDAGIIAHRLRGQSEEIDGTLAERAGDEGAWAEAEATDGGRAAGDRQVAFMPTHERAPEWGKLRLPNYAWTALVLAAAGSAVLFQWIQSRDSNEIPSVANGSQPAALVSSGPPVPDGSRLAPEPEPSRQADKPRPEKPSGAAVPGSGAVAREDQSQDEPRHAGPELGRKKQANRSPPKQPSGAAVESDHAPVRQAQPSVTPSASGAAPAPAMQRLVAARVAAPASLQTKTATLVFDVSPWGEIYVDGRSRGTTPPVKTLDVPPGSYRIEVRNSARLPYLGYATLEAGDVQRIRHEFQ
jgi:serine/threonine-protein kinase